ncbi:phosphotransferase family protein [Nocardia jejuensis]|uniref:phosphotransferase family protein n=1 Tax=Nocardia jejuensis TaxID=328049 RepID=UPI000830214D|nr:aminoglycoside phosphotransferase family protein [Nocardia jejuensis]
MNTSAVGTSEGAGSNSLPSTPSEITAEWLGSVLGERISSVRVDPVGTGQTGATYRVTPVYAGPTRLPPSFVAKLPSQHAEVRERVALGYRAEHAFYTRVAHTLDVPVPQVFHCDIAGDGAEFVLVVSDLTPAVQGDQVRGCGQEQARLAVEALAGLHGPRWCDPAWVGFDGIAMPKADADFARGMGELARIAWERTLSGLGTRIDRDDRAVLAASADLVEGWLGLDDERFCLLHGDYRLDNLLFDPAKAVVTVVDWQTLTVGLPARDLAYFLGTSMESDARERSEVQLVETYRRRVLGYGIGEYSAERCWTDYRIGMLQIPLITTFGYAFTAATDRGDDMMLTMIRRGCHAIRHLGTIDLVAGLI